VSNDKYLEQYSEGFQVLKAVTMKVSTAVQWHPNFSCNTSLPASGMKNKSSKKPAEAVAR
jgi:hypothetical protein